ncbi:SURF1 family protein [Alteromonas sp. ASW11-36]|uniref:SURF1-like protein n=1 Tax=Alteromonas arenosi TaxID=3055817 RepID=A0ABT7T0S2_9ALTE|nr:SURF1 family protein [Alteromonas sp. ASW11-36]MDM7862043.1 SURF1 family protein [Alteromonas sp. ASW11-36]
MVAANKTVPVLATLVTFVAIVTMLRLGFWQLERMDYKQQRLADLADRQTREPVDLVTLNSYPYELADIPVAFVGTPDENRLLLLDNRIVDGQVGYEVLAFAETNVGSVLVNYGWIKAPATRDQLPVIDIAAGQQVFEGNVVIPNINPVVRETATQNSEFPLRIQQLDLDRIAQLTNTNLQPFVIALAQQNSTFINNWRPVVMAPEKHLGYAIQWFGLAGAAFIIFTIALFKRKKTSDQV